MNLLSKRLLVGAVVLWMTSAGAQTSYPGKAIRLLVPTPAGGPSDAAARALAKGMTAGLGQEVLVENRPGAGTVVGLDARGRPIVRRGWKTIEQIAAEHRALFPEPIAGGPLGVDIIREERDSR